VGANLSNLSPKEELAVENHTELGSNLSNLSNLSFKNQEINIDKAENNRSVLINLDLGSKEELFELDELAGDSKAVELTVSAANLSTNLSQERELDGLESVTKQQVVPPSPPDDEVLLKGTKVCCGRLEKDGVVYSSRWKEFKKPNGTTEVVLQYYVNLGGEVYKWCDWDLVVAI
jgi:hypothetical protein